MDTIPTDTPAPENELTALFEGNIPHLISSFEGTGQYSQGSSSGCGLAALNAVRVILGREKAGLTGLDLVAYLGVKDLIDEIIAICAKWSSRLHLEANEIAALPLFENCLTLEDEAFHEATLANIGSVVKKLKSMSKDHLKSSVAVVITRPPEIFTVLYIPFMNSIREGVFAVFDSHPRPSFGTTGSSFILFSQQDLVVQYIFSLIRIDTEIRVDDIQTQLLRHFSGLFFRIRDDYNIDGDPKSLIYDTNLEILQLRHTVQELKQTTKELSTEISTLRSCLQDQSRARSKVSDDQPKNFPSSWSSMFTHLGSYSFKDKEESSFGAKPNAPSRSRGRGQKPGPSSGSVNTRKGNDSPESTEDARVARQMQDAFNEEDYELRAQAHMLVQQAIERTFECSICFERAPYDSVALIEGCAHEMCRQCAKGFLDVKLDEGRYPIICPMCQASKNVKEPGVITRSLVEQLSLTEQQIKIWYELEMSELSIILDCPSCRRSTFVDRVDHTTMKLLTCPLPDCRRSWCKECSQSVQSANSVHSCDGSMELDDLVKNSGWMYCPGCKTPTERYTGCNHITCIGKGCNMHYCYRCHEPIVRSAIRDTIASSIQEHYSRCQLFEVL